MSKRISLERAAELLKNVHSLVLTAHVSPDGDCLGSMLALYYCLISIGKDVKMLLDDDIPHVYHFLPGSELITRPSEHKISADLLVVLDASDLERTGNVKNVLDAPILNLDHHVSNLHFADYYYLDDKAAATGEIIFELFQLLNYQMDVSVAICLYTAIATDCGFFRYGNTTPNTMLYGAKLLECGVKPHIISEYMETKSVSAVLALTKVLETLEFYCDGKIASITVYKGLLSDTDSSDGFINYPRTIEGVEIAIMFKVVDAETTRVSMRSKTADVSKLALIFGGGGHARAAGCTFAGNLAAAKDAIVSEAKKQIGEIV